MPDAQAQQAAKLAAAKAALRFIEPGMIVGLGSGSTATLFIQMLGEKVQQGLDIKGIASSEDSEVLGRKLGIPITDFDHHTTIDVAVDGADEVAPGLALIKGGGGKLLREKIVASATRRFVVVADESKIVKTLGSTMALPVEVIPMAAPLVRRTLQELGFSVDLRRIGDGSPYITDEGNLLFDCHGVLIEDPEKMAAILDRTVGVVEHGIFLHLAHLAIVATENGIIERTE
jgi:ribose 5-phosphate isomerase A